MVNWKVEFSDYREWVFFQQIRDFWKYPVPRIFDSNYRIVAAAVGKDVAYNDRRG